MIIHSQSDGASSENSETSWENAIKQAFKPVQSRSKLTWMTDYWLRAADIGFKFFKCLACILIAEYNIIEINLHIDP